MAASTQAASSAKYGYDIEFIADPPKSLECPVCLLALREPHVISCCGHHFCRPCIERVLRDKKPCPLCNDESFTVMLHKGVLREVNALMVRCPQKQLGCKWEGELGQVQRHVCVVNGDCGYVEVECVYHCGERFLRRLTDEHKGACSKLPLEVQLSNAMKKLDVALADNQTLRGEVAQLKKTNIATNIKLQGLQAECDARKADSDSLRSQFVRLETSLSKQVSELVQQCKRLESRQNPVPPLIFDVYNVDHHKKEDIRWVSPSFYSHTGGYRMKLFVYPNGFDDGCGSHVSLFVCLERGEYDDQLHWPFVGSVKVQVFNRTSNKWDKSIKIKFPAHEPASQRPLPFAQSSYGHSHCIPHSELNWYSGTVGVLHIRVVSVMRCLFDI